MDRESFNANWMALIAAFPNSKVTPESQDVYWTMLKDIPRDWFEKGVRACLGECTFFPTINDLGRASVPMETGGGWLNVHTYIPEFEVPWPRSLEKYAAKKRAQIDAKEREQVTEGKINA